MVLETCKVDLVPAPVRGGRAGGFLLSILFALLLAVGNVRGASAQTKPAVAAADDTPHFEVAAIKPSKPDSEGQNWHGSADRILIGNYTLRRLIRSAYGLKSDAQILGGPDWIDKQAFDINAKIDDAEIAKMAKMDRVARQRERNQMVQSLLAERFMLKAHLDHKTMPVYALVVVKSGAKLTPTSPETSAKGNNISTNNGRMTASAISMDSFADDLAYQRETGGRMVLNHTGLTGEYDFKLDWAEDNGDSTPADPALADLFTALQEQLGLKLQPEKGSVEVVVVESASMPAFE
jgi:uncharacterized protein (TIGR03435 family)